MRGLSYGQICAMKGNGSSMRHVLKYFIDKGGSVELAYESSAPSVERFFVVHYDGLSIPLRAWDLNFYCVFNSHLARTVASDKIAFQALFSESEVLVPAGILHTDISTTEAFLQNHNTIVVKPRSGAHGDGITVGVQNTESLRQAIDQAQTIHDQTLVQQQVTGDDFRLLFINHRFVAAVKRTPASITGDGIHSIRQLVEQANKQRIQTARNVRSGIQSADQTRGALSPTPLKEVVAARGEDFLEYLPSKGEIVQVVDKANVSLGGQTIDVTDQVNHKLTDALAKSLKNIGLSLCGVDIMSSDIGSDPSQQKSFVIELNAAPGLRLHELPTEGQSRPVCGMVAESLIEYYKKLA